MKELIVKCLKRFTSSSGFSLISFVLCIFIIQFLKYTIFIKEADSNPFSSENYVEYPLNPTRVYNVGIQVSKSREVQYFGRMYVRPFREGGVFTLQEKINIFLVFVLQKSSIISCDGDGRSPSSAQC